MNHVQQANLQFAPILNCIINFFGLYATLAAGFIIAVFTPSHNIPLCVGICFIIFSYYSMGWWNLCWMERAKQIRKLDIAEARGLQGWPEADKGALIRGIRRRSSGLFRSYFIYFLPHALFAGLWYLMFGTFAPSVPY